MAAAIYRKHVSICSLLLIGVLLCSVWATKPAAAASRLLRTIDTSAWNPASPDPSGITYWPARGRLLIVDGEVDETPHYAGKNVFEASLTGTLHNTYSTSAYTNEPVGIDIRVDPTTSQFFIADDSKKTIFMVALGADRAFGTADDVLTSFSTAAFGNNDPEGLTFGTINGQRRLFTIDGAGRKVYIQAPGPNTRFDGVAPQGDDRVTSLDLAPLGVGDPEGIEFDPATGRLYIVDRKLHRIIDITTAGAVIGTINLRPFNVVNPVDLALAPSSSTTDDPAVRSLYIVDRGIDNSVDPNENDGKIFEITPELDPPPPDSLLKNGSFELDADSNGAPDNWSLNAKFTRSNELPHSGSFAGKFFATDNRGATITQTVGNITAGTTYNFSGWTNIPATNDSFTFTLEVTWLDAARAVLRTDTIKAYTDDTAGAWNEATGSFVAPPGVDKAQIRLVARSLKATIYVDDFKFNP